MKVLVAEDSTPIRKHLVEMMNNVPGIEKVIEAVNGWETVARVLDSEVDVLVLDMRMPLGNGLEVLDAIKAHIENVIVIVLTAYPFPQYRKKCLESGASYFFDKTKELDSFTEVITKIAMKREAG